MLAFYIYYHLTKMIYCIAQKMKKRRQENQTVHIRKGLYFWRNTMKDST